MSLFATNTEGLTVWLGTFSLFYNQSTDTAVRNIHNFNTETKWAFLQPLIRLKFLFAQCQILSLQIRRSWLNFHRFCKAIRRTIPPLEQWPQRSPYVWVTKMADRWYDICCINKVKIASFTYKNIFQFLLNSLLSPFFYISGYSGYYVPRLILLLYFSLYWRRTFSAIKTSNRACNCKHWTWFSDCIPILTQISNWSGS